MALAAEAVTMRFGGLTAIDDVSIRLEEGEILGLIGPNGAGKTTLVNILSGFQRPDTGSIAMAGRHLTGRPAHHFARAGIVRTFQSVRLFRELTVSENIEVGCVSAGQRRREARQRAAEMLDYLGLSAKAALPASALTYGDERRIGLGRALALKPKFLLLDEPAAGLNVAEAEQLRHLIADIGKVFGCGLLVIEHNMTLIMSLCQRIHVLATGRSLAAGTPAEMLGNDSVRRAYLGSEAA